MLTRNIFASIALASVLAVILSPTWGLSQYPGATDTALASTAATLPNVRLSQVMKTSEQRIIHPAEQAAHSAEAVISQVTADAQARQAAITAPIRLMIPAIHLDAGVVGVGLTASGEMAVPSGSSDQVGWYRNGPMPGQTGSAVMDAHVFAAFSKLRYVMPGSDIYVITKDDQKLHFIVQDARVYDLAELTSNMLFGLNDGKRLNLITCAGTPTADGSTYTKRLVVYATLVSD